MKLKDDSFFKTIRNFLTIYLPRQKCYSPNTVDSYRITLNLFIDYLVKVKTFRIQQISFSHMNKENVSGFLEWLRAERRSGASTQNQRLMALRAFAKYAGFTDAMQVSVHMELSCIPVKKTKPRIVEFLSENALKVLLEQPDRNRHLGYRDCFFMILMYDTAARCQEILDLRLNDFELNSKSPFVYLTGKGGKTRTVPLMQKAVEHLKIYLSKFHPTEQRKKDDFLFFTVIHGEKNRMSPDNVASFMKKYGEMAKQTCNEIPEKIHPHQLRHTRAIHLYRGGMPLALLAEFLGHVELATTQIYAYADTEMKRKAIQKACLDSNTPSELPIWGDDEETIRKLYGLR